MIRVTKSADSSCRDIILSLPTTSIYAVMLPTGVFDHEWITLYIIKLHLKLSLDSV